MVYRSVDIIVENSELVKLHEFSMILNSTYNIDQIITKSARLMREMLAGDGCHILLARKLSDQLQLSTAVHDGGKPFPAEVDETKGISGTTFATGRLIVVEDAEKDARVSRRIQEYFGHRSLISVPITSKGEVIGVVVIYSRLRAKFSQRDAEFLLLLSSQLGLALENARLVMLLQSAAFTDPMTGAFNHGFFRIKLANLIREQPEELLSLILLDVNDLKVINDNYGHTTGDYILRELTKVLKKQVRGCDVVARYGGDEFAVILPGADSEESLGIASKIQHAVAEQEFNRLNCFKVSVSWGTITTRCKDIKEIDQIIDAADNRLYNMKKNRQAKRQPS